jgi:4-amino-4-deoxy-L-arabinose transferase-like glycosyltransferase
LTAGGEPRQDRDGRFGLALFALALAPRLYVALAWSGEPVWDGHYYDFAARRIADGFGYSDDLEIGGHLVWHPWCHYPVGYSGALALFYRFFGGGPAVAGVFDALVGAALAVVTWLLAREAMSKHRARAAGLLMALHPGMILYAALVMTEPLAALLTLLSFWITVRDPQPKRGAIAGALVLGVAALVRPQALLCAPFLAARVVPPVRTWLHPLSNAAKVLGGVAAVCALTLVPVLPWTARNCAVMDGCALVSTNGGWNLAIGAFPRATGRFETLHASDGCREVTGQVQQDRCWFAYGVGEITAHPGHWLGLIPAKLGFTFDHESFEVEYLHEARPNDWPEAKRAAGRDLMTTVHRLLLCAAALGCVAFPRRGERGRDLRAQSIALAGILLLAAIAVTARTPTFWPLALATAALPWIPIPGSPPWPWSLRLPVALLATTVITHAVFFGEDRYHVVVTPVLALLAAGALRRSPTSEARSGRSPAKIEPKSSAGSV